VFAGFFLAFLFIVLLCDPTETEKKDSINQKGGQCF